MARNRQCGPTKLAALAVTTASIVGLWSSTAHADWSKPGDLTRRRRQTFCIFFSGPACTHSIYLDAVGAYQRNIDRYGGDKDFGRLGGELGYAVRLGNSTVQIGPALEAGGIANDTTVGWQLVPKLRLRSWPGHTGVALEVAPGFAYVVQEPKPLAGGAFLRMGGHAEVGVSFYGAVTIVTGGEYLRDATGTSSGMLFAGLRMTAPIVPWAILAAAFKR